MRNSLSWKIKYGDWYTRKKLKNGQTAFVSFFLDKGELGIVRRYTVALVIVKKRKALNYTDYYDDRLTGDGSLEGLLFAKQAIKDFEKEVWHDCAIYVGGSDGRRQRLYERYFRRMGYERENFEGLMYMVKRVKKDGME